MKALRRAVWLLALPVAVCAQPVETAVAPEAMTAPAPAAIAVALRAEIQQLSPLAGTPALADELQNRLASPATPEQALACRYLASSLESDAALPLVQSFVLRSRAPEAASINAELSRLAAPYRADPRLRADLIEAAGLRITDPDKLRSSLDALFEKSSEKGAASADAVLGAAPRAAGPAPSDIPRLGPSIADLDAHGAQAPMRTGSFHENDPAKVIVMHQPGSELGLANTHWESALFTGPVDWKGAAAEHENYRKALEAEGAQVYLVRDVLLEGTVDERGREIPGPKLDALRALAGQFLKYDTRPLRSELEGLERYAARLPEGPSKRDVQAKVAGMKGKITAESQEAYRQETLRSLSPESLVDVIFEQPAIKLHIQSHKSKNAFYVGFRQEVKVRPLMNMYFARDQQITTHKGVVINKMSFDQRKPEPMIMKFVFEKLGVPIVAELKDGTMDGGDYIPAGDLVFQGIGLRTTMGAVKQLMREDAYGAKEVAVVIDANDQSMDRMHLDTVFNVLSDDKVLALDDLFKDPKKQRVVDLYRRTDKVQGPLGHYAKVEQGVDFETFLKERGFQIATVSDQDQLHYALNFLNVGGGRVLTPYGNEHYLEKLRSLGVDAEYVPMKCLTDGYGAAHCMTQVISRGPRL